ncbi:Glutathione S-transferase class-mu 26 kDa isozyme 51 [Orchesella cincta]|uniref:glutathione transferase n=1 Tax=Orchesella cincta TaxID=48709 RepID=A0A1D2N5T6_ORCCI|nr:Glutathione S-transferase class-mu 26 kDa isozyme 51 [Orchesella cincta]
MTPWFVQKYSHGLDFPNLPYYIDGDVRITQSFAILQYIARKYNLYGDTIEEQATIDMVSQTVNDLRSAAWVTYNDPKFHQIKDEWKKTVPGRLGDLNKFLEGKTFVLGTKLSFVDFVVYEFMEWYRQCIPDVFEQPELANLNSFQLRITEIPQIKEYLNSDKFKSWPFFAPVVNFGFSKAS